MKSWFDRGMRHLSVLALVLFPVLFSCGVARADPPHPVLYKGERLVRVELLPGKPLHLKGWTRDGRGTVYSLHVRQGETVGLNFWAQSRFTYLVIFDAAKPDEDAFYGSDEDGNVKTFRIAKSTTWLVRPYYSKAVPRRGIGAPYSITLDIRR